MKKQVFTLRDYQEEAKEAADKALEKYDRECTVLPTGSGKTNVFISRIENWVNNGKRVLVLINRLTLLDQTYFRTTDVIGPDVGYIGNCEFRLGDKVVVACVPSLVTRLNRFSKDHFDHIVIDECHHAYAETYQTIINYYDKAKVSGYTATPAQVEDFDLFHRSYTVEITELIEREWLCPIKFMRLGYQIDPESLESNGYEDDDWMENVIKTFLKIPGIRKRKTLVYLPLIKTSKKFMKCLAKYGVRSAHIDYSTSRTKTRHIINLLRKGKLDVITNSMKLTEGVDIPEVDCILLLRPTHSELLYRQIVGRGTRKAEGKKDLLVVDPIFVSKRFNITDNDTIIKEYISKNDDDDKVIAVSGERPENVGKLVDSLEEHKDKYDFEDIDMYTKQDLRWQELKDHVEQKYSLDLDEEVKDKRLVILPDGKAIVEINSPKTVDRQIILTEQWLAEALIKTEVPYGNPASNFRILKACNPDKLLELKEIVEERYGKEKLGRFLRQIPSIINAPKYVDREDSVVEYEDRFINENPLFCTEENLTLVSKAIDY